MEWGFWWKGLIWSLKSQTVAPDYFLQYSLLSLFNFSLWDRDTIFSKKEYIFYINHINISLSWICLDASLCKGIFNDVSNYRSLLELLLFFFYYLRLEKDINSVIFTLILCTKLCYQVSLPQISSVTSCI